MKTKEIISITEIQKMVEEWYEGSIDKNRDEVLFAYFSETPDEDIPTELKEDAEIFRSLSSRFTKCPDAELLRVIEEQIRKEKKQILVKRLIRFSALFSTAACIGALIFGLSYFKIDKINESPSDADKHIASNNDLHTKDFTDSFNYIKPKDFSDRIAVNNVHKSRKTKASQLREVTDINEAIAILEKIDTDLEKTLSIGAETINDIEAILSEQTRKQKR